MDQNALHLEWQENVTKPEIKAPSQEGFGSKLARTSAIHQLGGSIDFAWLPGGVNIALTAAGERLGK
jgi:two-component sensor histidine kinase